MQKAKIALARQNLDKHLAQVSTERAFLKNIRLQDLADEDMFYMEIDGMDQSKTNLPHYPNQPKDVNKDLLMQIHVTGVRYSGNRPNDIYLYTNTFAHDSACTCTIIYMTVTKVRRKIIIFLSSLH